MRRTRLLRLDLQHDSGQSNMNASSGRCQCNVTDWTGCWKQGGMHQWGTGWTNYGTLWFLEKILGHLNRSKLVPSVMHTNWPQHWYKRMRAGERSENLHLLCKSTSINFIIILYPPLNHLNFLQQTLNDL